MADEAAVLEVDDQVSHVDTSISESLAPETNTSEPAGQDLGSMLDEASQAGDPTGVSASSPAPQDLRGLLSQQGFSLDGVDDTQLAASFVQTYQQAQQAQQYQAQLAQYQQQLAQAEQLASYGRQVYPHFDKFQAFMAQQQQVAQQPAPVPPQHPAIKPKPEYDPSWENRVRFDAEAGRFVPADQWTMPDVAEKVNAYHEWKRETAETLLNNYVPPEQLEQQILAKAEARFEEKMQAMQQHQQVMQYTSQAVSQLTPLVFQQQNGQFVTDAQGNRQLTEPGAAYCNTVAMLNDNGITDPRLQDAIGRQVMAGYLRNQQPVQQPQVAAPVVDPRAAFVQRNNGAQRRPNQNGTVLRAEAHPSVAQNPRASLSQMLDEGARAAGILNT